MGCEESATPLQGAGRLSRHASGVYKLSFGAEAVIVQLLIQTLSGNSQHLSGKALVAFAFRESVNDELSFGFFQRQDVWMRESSGLSLSGVLHKSFREVC